MSDRKQWRRRVLPVCSAPGERSRSLLLAVMQSADVAHHPRYARTADGRTWCKTFVWDVTSAMGVEVPHWVKDGQAAEPGAPGAVERRANDVPAWCETHPDVWHPCDHLVGQEKANAGHPVLLTWVNTTGGPGHVAVAVPSSGLPRIAQAGVRNFEHGGVEEGFGARTVRWWWAD